MIIIIIIVLLAAVWFFMCMPNPGFSRARKFAGTPFAHRGLHDETCAENSLAAFEKACQAGVGIELDVQFTADKKLIVFHDNDLLRMTGRNALVRDLTYDEICSLKLVTDGSPIPTFEEVLACVNCRVPLLVEIKSCRDIKQLTLATAEMLAGYKGSYFVESFNPICLLHLRKYFPGIIRGQLVTSRNDYKDQSGVVAFLLSRLMLNFLARPDFIAYNHKAPMNFPMWFIKKLLHTSMASWTITDKSLHQALIARGEMPIFEKFLH